MSKIAIRRKASVGHSFDKASTFGLSSPGNGCFFSGHLLHHTFFLVSKWTSRAAKINKYVSALSSAVAVGGVKRY